MMADNWAGTKAVYSAVQKVDQGVVLSDVDSAGMKAVDSAVQTADELAVRLAGNSAAISVDRLVDESVETMAGNWASQLDIDSAGTKAVDSVVQTADARVGWLDS
jgi:hypothetical protein